jgi:WD40 repeat protein
VLTQHVGPVDSVAFAPDSKSFVSGGADGRVLIWDTGTLKPQELGGVYPPGKFTAVAFSPDGKRVAVTREKVTGFFDPEKRRSVLMRPPVPGGTAVAFSPNGKYVATSNGVYTGFRALPPGDGTAGIGGPKEPEALADKLPAAVAWSADSLYLAYVLPTGPDQDGLVVVMGVTPETKPANLTGPKGQVTALAWSKDGKVLASGGSDGTVIFRDGAPPFKELRRAKLVGRDGGPTLFHSLAFSPDGKTLAAAVTLGSGKSVDRIALIDTEAAKWAENLFPPVAPVRSVAFSPDGKLLVAACGIDRERLKPLMTPDEMKAAGAVVVWERKP